MTFKFAVLGILAVSMATLVADCEAEFAKAADELRKLTS